MNSHITFTGHVATWGLQPSSINEIVDNGDNGSIEDQTFEADADGYADYVSMSNLIEGGVRANALTALGP